MEPLWKSANIIELVNKALGLDAKAPNVLYANLPYWETPDPDYVKTWCLMAGDYDKKTDVIKTEASIALVKIARATGDTELLAVEKCPGQWNNNTFAVTKSGAIFVTNGGRLSTDTEVKADSYIWKVGAVNDKSAMNGYYLNVSKQFSLHQNCQMICRSRGSTLKVVRKEAPLLLAPTGENF